MVNFSQFMTTDDMGQNIKNALAYCKENKVDVLSFPKDTYRVNGNSVETRTLSISNHSHGDRKVCFLLEDQENLTIDFNGGELYTEDLMVDFALIGCKNITIQNLSIYNGVTLAEEGVFTDVTENGFTIKVEDGGKVYTDGEKLYSGDPEGTFQPLASMNEWDKETGLLVPYQADIGLSGFTFEQVGENTFTATQKTDAMTKYVIKKGDRFCFQHAYRNSCGIFINVSENTVLKNVTIHNTMGMGVIAQSSKNIEIDGMRVTPKNGECHTLNADATHFVHCKGLIHIHDCIFERQLDDALNVHGIYLRITEKKENSVVLSFMHWQTLNIDIVHKGSLLETCDPNTLIPKKAYRVKEVKKLDLKTMEVFFEDDISDVLVGDNMNEISDPAEVIFENNVCINNRARAVLLASAGKTILRNNRFASSGRTILFESCGNYWFESGGVSDVEITGNIFYDCNYVGAYRNSGAVIMTVKRPSIEEGKYFHKKINVSNNKFINCKSRLVFANNTEEFIFAGNVIENCENPEPEVSYVKDFISL